MSLSGERKDFSCAVRIDTLIEQGLLCNNPKCHKAFQKERRPHFDHIKGRSDNSFENCQALCPNCHEIKNQIENKEESERRKKDQ